MTAGDRLWVSAPDALRRHWLLPGMVASDGGYLRAWPPAAIGVPVGGGIIGVLVAAGLRVLDRGPLYTYSFTAIAVMLAVSGLGAGVGVWMWAGFTVANLAIADRSALPAFGPFATFGSSPLTRTTHGWLPLLLTYALLLGVLVLVPLLGRLFGASAARALRRGAPAIATPVAALTSLLVVGVLTYAWAQAVPFMIRPLWSFSGSTPDIAAVQPVQAHPGALASVAVAAGVVRLTLEVLARPHLTGLPMPAAVAPRGGPLRATARLAWVPVQALLITLLLGGLVAGRAAGIALWLAICVIGLLRLLVVPRLTGWTAALRRIPLLVRVLACTVVSYVLTALVVQPAVNRGETSFTSLVIVVLAALAVAAFLLPAQPLTTADTP